jgi:hypothetical protein
MTDEDLLAQATSLVPIYIDGFGAFRKTNGVLRCVGWVFDSGAQLNLIVSLVGADQGTMVARQVLDDNTPTKGIHIWNGVRLAH